MENDLFAYWSSNKGRLIDIDNYFFKFKYLLTRDLTDARKEYQTLLQEIQFPDMSKYVPVLRIINSMPLFSFFLQFTFTLSKPYISRDDEEFYIIDNPVRKDKIFKVPMVSGSSWKGNMRWVAMKLFADNLPETLTQEDLKDFLYYRAQIVRLFGYEKDSIENYLDTILAEAFCTEDEKQNVELFKKKRTYISENFQKLLKDKGYIDPKVEGRRGRLNFYPTFFNQIGLEVINPHDRKTKAGTLPIYIECVPEGATGTLSLLYVPFDLMGKLDDLRKEVIEDLVLVYNSLKDMMLTYGFSAKKSSGFGIVDDHIEGIIDMSGGTLYKDNDSVGKEISSSPFAKLSELKLEKPKDNTFLSFDDLRRIIERLRNEVLKND